MSNARHWTAPMRLLWLLSLCCSAMAVPAQPMATHEPTLARFEIDMRAEIAAGRFDPSKDSVGIRGGRAPLSWSRPVMAAPATQGRFAAELRFDRPPYGGQPVQYKFRIEREGQGPDAGWEEGRNHALVLQPPVTRVARSFNAPSARIPPRRTGQIDRLGVVVSKHVMPRPVQVWLPPGYAQSGDRRYPVLYLQDGQNVFDDEVAGAEWMVDETAQRLAQDALIDAPIIVAIDSTRDRIKDYTPTEISLPAERTGSGRAERVGGGAAAYARYLVDEVKPLIDQRYRTRKDVASTAVGGSSLGGLLSLWLVLEHGQTFGSALVVSPSVWWDDMLLRRDVLARSWPGDLRPRVWLDMGGLEGDRALSEARQLQQALMSRGWGSQTLAYAEDPHGSHDEVSWASRVEGMLRFLYGRPVSPSP